MKRCIAFHSYKGGTGKTTIAANLAALLVTRGFKVSLLDLDVYAPSLQAYFDYTPKKWINDFLHDSTDLENVMIDLTSLIEGYGGKESTKNGGKFWLGFSNPQKEEIIRLEGQGRQSSTSIQLLRKFIELREELVSDYDCDYVIIDTSPGIRYWSINSLAIADTLLLALKLDKMDIEGTRKMARDLYDSLKKLGAKPYLLLNRTSGYCVPNSLTSQENAPLTLPQQQASDINNRLLRETGFDIISTIPCYCDIQFSTAEFLTVLRYPDHPFAKQLGEIAASNSMKV